MDYEKKLALAKEALDSGSYDKETIEYIFPELKESEDERIRKEIISYLKRRLKMNSSIPAAIGYWIAWLEKQGGEPNWCHHKVDLSNYSDEYCKAYYDGWNNCNMQHSQCRSELDDVVKCLINGMKFYYEDNEEATWGTDKWSMPVKHIIEVLEKQGEKKLIDKIQLGKKYKCIASPRYSTFMIGKIYKPEDKFLCSLMNLCSDCFELIEDGEQKTAEEYNITGIGSKHAQGKLGEMIKNLKHVNEILEQKSAWSEEDEAGLGDAMWAVEQARTIAKDENDMGNLWYAEHWLKSLKDRVQPQQEWSEEDDAKLKSILFHISDVENKDVIDWFKAIRPRSHWKPSDEQMVALQEAMNIVGILTITGSKINSLYQDLKKLKE